MVIKQASFIKSAADHKGFYEDGLPQIAIAGKSNVGKSSFINFITNNGKLAKTSSNPGHTRLVNFFMINRDFILVDLPGYGFAKAPKAEQEKWGNLIEGYFQNSKSLAHVILLLDIRHEPNADDLNLIRYFYYYHIPFSIIGTKSDKLSKAQLAQAKQRLASKLNLGVGNIFTVSALKKVGKENVLSLIDSILEAYALKKSSNEEIEEDIKDENH